MSGLAEAGADLLGGALCASAPLPGGALSGIVRIELTDGREAVIKSGPDPRAEAAMLEAIAAAGAPAPAVLAAGPGALAIELVPAGGRLGRAWPSLGAALAALHAKGGDGYGWDVDYAFGAVAIDNTRRERWPEFWGEQRLLAHVDALPKELGARVERIAAALPDRLPERPRPSLLHGDLWGGNVLVDGGRVSALIDPACYYGHAEVDLAMLELFDRPGPAFFAAYGALEPGHGERRAIYTLWPALVHLRLFGQSYRPLVERLLTNAGV